MTKEPKFSVIMPTYNRAFCIAKSVDSLLAQTYQNFELIITDDGSNDGTKELINNRYAEYLESKKIIYKYTNHVKVCRARNIALKIASGEWITYLDSDDIMLPFYLETYKDAIISNPDKKFFYAQMRTTDGQIIGHEFNYYELTCGNYISTGLIVHSKSLYKKYGGFDVKLKSLEDWDLALRYTKNNEPVFINKVVLKYNSKEDHPRMSTTQNHEIAIARIKNKLNRFKKCKKFLQFVFSVKNEDTHKVLTVFGIKIKFKRKSRKNKRP